MRTAILLSFCSVGIFLLSCGPGDREIILQAIPDRPDLSGWPDRLYQRIENAEVQALNGNRPIESLKELGRLYHANGFFSEATQCYVALVGLEPGSLKWPALLAATKEQVKGGSSLGSIKELWRFELYSDCFDPKQLAAEATLASQRGEVAEAIRLLKRTIQLSPQDAALHFELGNGYLESGEPAKALESYNYSVEVDPGFSRAWYQIALIHSNAGNVDEESRALATGLSHNPNSKDLLGAAVRSFKRTGDYKEAEE